MKNYSHLKLEVKENVGHLTLSRKNAANSLNVEFILEILSALEDLKNDMAVRSIILNAEGPVFCSGVDLLYIQEQGENGHKALELLSKHLHEAIISLAQMPKPVVCVVSGVAAGAGLGMALACDIILSGEKAKFTTAFTAAGLSPDSAITWFLPRLIGYRRAKELLLTSRMVRSSEALEIGLVDKVVSEDDLNNVAMVEAVKLAKGPMNAYGMVKELLMQSFQTNLKDQMTDEASMILNQATSSEGMEGINAFFEKRPANFP
jgi:2-(1,2-epoxy-1,2-dihydrophenyl)acetyl-CoA isomerase